MSEEQIDQSMPQEVESASSFDLVEETMDAFFQVADVSAVYGEPVQYGETLIIPTAEVFSVMGFGVGEGSGSAPEDNGSGFGSGGGGGGKSFSRPVAVIVAGPGGVEVKKVIDVTKIVLAALTAWGFMGVMAMRMSRRPRFK
jgi:uncharacterized spore protein YtfJ